MDKKAKAEAKRNRREQRKQGEDVDDKEPQGVDLNARHVDDPPDAIE